MENVIVVLSNEETVRRIHADTPEAVCKFCVASEGETEFNRGVIQDGVTGEMLGCFVLMGSKEPVCTAPSGCPPNSSSLWTPTTVWLRVRAESKTQSRPR